ncbi:hypothetical protein O6H91_08G092600 [Diphasiastrum complanatum]|uniref:Uncharacterized protein n=1 Tax=Diphasiastrum complanatum TaxID=34168 RepID=A0ACC2D084_DIPCM|nr:hypothetical protein O6H91_08G092600 [Diphasiastrum complanatum]
MVIDEGGNGVEMQSPPDDSSETPGLSRKSTPRKLRRVDSMELESIRVTGMENHGFPKLFSTKTTLRLAFQTIGVVYGDVGTSPLYVYSSTFPNGINTQHTNQDVLGALSLIIYTLTLIPLLKYVFIVLRANDRGEGGTFALYSLISRHAKVTLIPNQNLEDRKLSGYKLDLPNKVKYSSRVKQKLETSRLAQVLLLLLALIGTCMVIGDGVLTPAISVLSAVEGIKVQATSLSQNVVVIISCVILVLLFSVQQLGTDKVGFIFAPCVFVWFMFIGLIGLYNIFKYDAGVFRAFNPKYMYDYFKVNKKDAWTSLGGVVLCITGTEAMFADLGHFSVRSIQIAFTALVYPSLLSAYIGQAAYLLKHPEHVDQTFYKSIPGPVYWPQFVVAVIAAIIASQAMISATFSIIKQSMALGCFPRVKIVHTSQKHMGQIYIPELNWFLMVACVIITAAFKNTTQIGNAYGICVVAVMVVTTSFLTIIMLMIWQINIFLALGFLIVFGSIELFYLTSVLEKFTQGGWLPLLFAGIFLAIMISWYYGNATKYKYDVKNVVSTEWIMDNLKVTRVPGIGLVYTEVAQGIPEIFSHFISNLPAMQSVIIFVSVKHLPVANVLREERFLFRRVGRKQHHVYRCIARYGYQDATEKNETFEILLLDWLAHFMKAEALETEQPLDNSQSQTGEITVSIYPSKVLPLDQSSIQQTSVIESDGVEAELTFLAKAKQDGIIYILGHSDIKASNDSSILKKILINYAYTFLRRNFRESVVSLDIPNKKLLKVGMSYQI